MNKNQENNKRKKKIVLNVLIIVFAIVFVISTAVFVFNIYRSQKETNDLNTLSKEKTDLIELKVKDSDEDNLEVDYDEALIYSNNQMNEKNSDMNGWIKITNTLVDYPVMYTPEDFQKYLRKDFTGNYSLAGLPFLGDGNSIDYPEFNTIIYSHNMNNGTMFHDILKYESKEFRDENPIIEFSTLDEVRKYEVVSAFRIDVSTDSFRYYNYVGWDNQTNQDFIDEIKSRSFYDTDIDLSVYDQMLTLSTCDYYSEEGRFVVVAKRVDDYVNKVNPEEKDSTPIEGVIDETN